MLRSRWLTPLFTAFIASACTGTTPPGTPSPRDPTPRVPETEISTTAEYDLIIENGRIVDGTGSAWFYGDIAVKNGRIARIVPKGVLRGTSASQRIDAYDHVVSPGFIDIQSQSRYALLDGDSKVISKVTQGITTEIMGEGTSSAPINPAYLARAGADDSRIERRRRSFAGPHGFDLSIADQMTRLVGQWCMHGQVIDAWQHLGGRVKRLDAQGEVVEIAALDSRAGAAEPAKLGIKGHQIDDRRAGAKLVEAATTAYTFKLAPGAYTGAISIDRTNATQSFCIEGSGQDCTFVQAGANFAAGAASNVLLFRDF